MPNKTRLMLLSLCLIASWVIALNSIAQTPSSSKPTHKSQDDPRSVTPTQQPPTAKPDFSQNTWDLPADYARTKNPTATSDESVAKGKELYLDAKKGNCVFCHGETGTGNEANLAKLRRKPADISNKERMSEMTDGELYWKISKGIPQIMPAGERRMTDEERWNVVNYIRTLVKDK